MTDYRGWRISDDYPLSDEVQRAIENYIKHNGEPPNIIETGLTELPAPDGMIVRKIRLPSNVLLIGLTD